MDTEYFGEFGYELTLTIPYAHWLAQQGRLGRTSSVAGTKELYYFSPDHTEVRDLQRTFRRPPLRNSSVSIKDLDYSEWSPPLYKDHFRNETLTFGKPLWIVHNKYTREWGGDPINYLDAPTLDALLVRLHRAYQVVYIRPDLEAIQRDSGYVVDHNEFEGGLRDDAVLDKVEYRDSVLTFQQLMRAHPDITYNRLQLMLHANCDRFVSVQGGNSVLASYFGGVNIVYAKRGVEVVHDSYNGYFKRFSGCDVAQFDDYTALLAKVDAIVAADAAAPRPVASVPRPRSIL
jgi:hypothetical protein